MGKFTKSFGHAGRGIVVGFRERNMKIHYSASFIAVILSIYFKISIAEVLALTLSIGLVVASEMMNTAVEYVCDVARDNLGTDYEVTRNARDVAAGSVLLAAITALVVGLIIFVPKILTLI